MKTYIVDLLVVLLLGLGKVLPFLGHLLCDVVPVTSTLRSLLRRSLQEKSHVRIHGFARGRH